MIEQNMIRALPDDLSAYPNLEKMLSELSYTRYKDGHYYAIPRISFRDPALSSTDAAMLVRKDWMETLGIGEPQSVEDFIAMAAAFSDADPDGNGLDDTIGYNVNAVSALGKWLILGIAPQCNVYTWIEQDGRYIPSWYSDDFYEVVRVYRKLYESGGLDPDFYTKNPTETLTDFASGRLGALEYKSSPSSIKIIVDLWNQYQEKPFEECVDVLPMFAAPDGKIYCNSSLSFWSESFISASVSDEKLDRILQLYDYLLSEEGINMGKYGIEGVDFVLSEDGNPECLLDLSETSLSDILSDKYPSIVLFSGLATWGGSYQDFALNDLNYQIYGESSVRLANKDLNQTIKRAIPVTRPSDFLICPMESSELFSTTNAFDAFVRCILGKEDPELMWSKVIRTMQAAGLDDYIERQNQTFEAEQTAREKNR